MSSPSDEAKGKRTIALITTHCQSLWLFHRGECTFWKERGFEVHVVASPGDFMEKLAQQTGVISHSVELTRAITPLRDIGALASLYRLLRRIAPDAIVYGTPKAALLGGMAGLMTGVPFRLLIMHGSRIFTATGMRRWLLCLAEWLSIALAHQVIFVSSSLRQVCEEEGIIARGKGIVQGEGSVCGVDAQALRDSVIPADDPVAIEVAALKRRKELEGLKVIGFVGRLAEDKGITELLKSWDTLTQSNENLVLALVGEWDESDPVPDAVRHRIETDPRIFMFGFRSTVGPFYDLMDVLALPTRREGFVLVVIEAAAMRVPTVAFDVVGACDSVVTGETGTLAPAGDVEAFTRAIQTYIDDEDLRRRHGDAGCARVERSFQQEEIWQKRLDLICHRLAVSTPERIAP